MGLAPLKQFGITKRHCDHPAGDFRRRLSGRSVDGHHGQRGSVHRRRRREDAAGDAEDHGRFRGRPCRAAGRKSQRALQSRAGGGWPHGHGVGRIFVEAHAEAELRHAFESFRRRAAGARSAERAEAPGAFTCTKPTVRSRAKTWSASAAWLLSSDVCALARCSTGSSSRWATTPCAERRERRC